MNADQAKRFAPYLAAYALGIMSFWGISAIVGGPATEIAPAHVDGGPRAGDTADDVRLRVATRNAPDVLPTVQLQDAARIGDDLAVRQLISDNVDVNSSDERGRTSLMLAAREGHQRVVTALLDAGANVEATATDGTTALLAAAAGGSEATVRMLLDHDADVTVKARNGATAHDVAIRNKHDAVARLIADEIDRNNRQRIMVTRAQFLLSKLGYDPGEIDGFAGRKTREAIAQFQKSQDMIANGKVTPALLTALDEKQKAVEANRVAKRATAERERVQQRNSASVKAFRKAADVRPAARKRKSDSAKGEDKEGSGFFSRAGRWLRNNAPSANKQPATPDSNFVID